MMSINVRLFGYFLFSSFMFVANSNFIVQCSTSYDNTLTSTNCTCGYVLNNTTNCTCVVTSSEKSQLPLENRKPIERCSNVSSQHVSSGNMQLGSCYKGSGGVKTFISNFGIPSSYDPKHIENTQWRLSYNGHNDSHLWMSIGCATNTKCSSIMNLASKCINVSYLACTHFEKTFEAHNVYFYAGKENETSNYPSSISLQIFDEMGKETYNNKMQRRIYSQSKNPRLAVYKNEAIRFRSGDLSPGYTMVLGGIQLDKLITDDCQFLYSFMTPNYNGFTHFWCPVGDALR